MRFLLKILCVLFFTFYFSLSYGYDIFNDESFNIKPLDKEFSIDDRVLLGLELGRHTLAMVEERLGSSDTIHPTENSPNYLCYYQTCREDKYYYLFEAGPLGGWNTLTSHIIGVNPPPFKGVESCTKLEIQKQITFQNGMGPSISRLKVNQLYGSPNISEVNYDVYFFLKKKKISDEVVLDKKEKMPWLEQNPYYYINSFAKFTYLNNKVNYIHISYTKSY